MAREQPAPTPRPGSVPDYSPRCFPSKSLTPLHRSKGNPYFVNPIFQPVGAQATTAGEITVSQQKHRPVLNAMLFHKNEFPCQALLNFFLRKRPPNKAGHLDVSPQGHCQFKIARGPGSKSQACCSQEIIRRRFHGSVTPAGLRRVSPLPLKRRVGPPFFGFVILPR